MSYPQVKRLVKPSESEIEQVVRVLIDAFEGDPFGPILLGGDLSLRHQFLRANIQAALIGGEVYVITVGPETQDIVGTTLWYPSGSSPFCSKEQRAGGWDKFLESVPDSTRSWWLDYFLPLENKLSTDAFTNGPEYMKNAWQLHYFGIMRAYHHKGLGKQIFEAVKARAEQAGSPIVVETTTEINIKIYNKLGLHVRGEVPVSSPAGSVRLWVLSSEPGRHHL